MKVLKLMTAISTMIETCKTFEPMVIQKIEKKMQTRIKI